MVIDDEIAGLITYPDSLLSKESKNCFPYIYILSFHWLTVAHSVDKLLKIRRVITKIVAFFHV